MTKRIFMTHQKKKIPDVIHYINDYLDNYKEYEIYVGCDSQVNKRNTIYSVVIGLRRIIDGVGHGVHVIHTKEKEKLTGNKKGDVIGRLWQEVVKVSEVAVMLTENGFDISSIEPQVDINAKKFSDGSKTENYSNAIYRQSLGYLKGLGFVNAKAKPESPISSYAADFYCKK